MPDWYAQSQGFDTTQPINNVVAANGYTYLENYLQALTPHAFPAAETQPFTVSTAFGHGADAFISENGGKPATSSGDGSGATLDVAWGGLGGTINQMLVLRFDLARLDPGTLSDASLTFTSASDIVGTHQFKLFGLDVGSPGSDWSEQSIDFQNAPGVAFDGNSATLGLDANSRTLPHILTLGTLTVSNVAAGENIVFEGANLAVFLNISSLAFTDGEDRVVTILLEQTNPGTAASFYSREGDPRAGPDAHPARPNCRRPRAGHDQPADHRPRALRGAPARRRSKLCRRLLSRRRP